MQRCPACSEQVTHGRYCPYCATPIDTPTSAPTATEIGAEASPVSAGSPDQGRFLPGSMLGSRYRIVGLLGRGGMGEVYRADDLKLGRPVALKLLPPELQHDAARLERFLNEARVALRVTHPNVCRVHDIGEVAGQHFLSMEYVDGETLSSLLRRIGQIPLKKAVEIARQVGAGLAAAHGEGVLHRDLKPANVMIDGQGRAKILDFGLAGLAETVAPGERVGTPAYMAPEQLAGGQVTARSDLYALGLVLFEVFTGRHAFDGDTSLERVEGRRSGKPPRPSRFVDGIDPAVERVVLGCLADDPTHRPDSALSVVAALPAGDLLAAALAAGETPPPELIAESTHARGLAPALAWGCLIGFAVMTVAVFLLARNAQLTRIVSPELPPEVLENEARQVLGELGHDLDEHDATHGFVEDRDLLFFVAGEDTSARRWARLGDHPASAITFWYRQSPERLEPARQLRMFPSHDDPPLIRPGMASVRMDVRGRLLRLHVVGPESGIERRAQPDWSPLFVAAGLDPGDFTPVAPSRTPPVETDFRSAWEGTYPAWDGLPVRIEAGAFHGVPVHFRIHWPWEPAVDDPSQGDDPWLRLRMILFFGGTTVAVIGALLVARRNQRHGRGDPRGATRLALFVFALHLAAWAFGAHHSLSSSGLERLEANVAWALYSGGLAWILYMALEPYARRLWPHMLVGWVRVVNGRLRDPVVGREILIGCFFGALWTLIVFLYQGLPPVLGLTPPLLQNVLGPEMEVVSLHGLSQILAMLFRQTRDSLYLILSVFVFILLMRMLLRKQWLAVLATVLVLTVAAEAGGGFPLLDLLISMILACLTVWIAFRCGLLAVTVTGWVFMLSLAYPLTFDLTAWYATGSIVFLVAATGLAVYGFVVSLAGRPVIRDVLGD